MMTQVQEFVQSPQSEQYWRDEDLDTSIFNPSSVNPAPGRERIKHLLIGSPKAVTGTIHFLQVIGYANVKDWSPLLPTPNPGEVMSILIRQISV